jgi:hypothetical protein
MSSITKKQTSLALVAVVFATAVIVTTITSIANVSSAVVDDNSTTIQSVTCDASGGPGQPGGTIPAGACSNSNTNSGSDVGNDDQ